MGSVKTRKSTSSTTVSVAFESLLRWTPTTRHLRPESCSTRSTWDTLLFHLDAHLDCDDALVEVLGAEHACLAVPPLLDSLSRSEVLADGAHPRQPHPQNSLAEATEVCMQARE